jgi:ribosomal protein L11 methyltransferase
VQIRNLLLLQGIKELHNMNNININWKILKLYLSRDLTDLALAFLSDFNFNGIEEKSDDESVTLLVYFEEAKLPKNILGLMKEAFPSMKAEIDWTEWDPRDESWRQYFKPFEIVPGIIIQPSWEHYDGKPEEHIITMDPKMAFGTGLHPTTRLCAQEIYDRSNNLNDNASLIDVGCGSGILCLVAHELGWPSITGVENDLEAASVARENMASNGAGDVSIYNDVSEVKGTFQMVVANILLNVLIELRDDLVKMVSKDGLLVLSGITDDQIDDLVKRYSPQMTHVETLEDEEWRCLIFKWSE